MAAAVELEHGFDMGGEGSFVVGGTAAEESVTTDFRGEWVDSPVGTVDRNDVFMR